jgi:hypothetical protein
VLGGELRVPRVCPLPLVRPQSGDWVPVSTACSTEASLQWMPGELQPLGEMLSGSFQGKVVGPEVRRLRSEPQLRLESSSPVRASGS